MLGIWQGDRREYVRQRRTHASRPAGFPAGRFTFTRRSILGKRIMKPTVPSIVLASMLVMSAVRSAAAHDMGAMDMSGGGHDAASGDMATSDPGAMSMSHDNMA